MSFQKCQLGDALTLKRGYDLPEYARNTGVIPVISSSGVTGTHSEAKVRGPGVVTGRYGTLGEVYYIENDFWPLNTALYVKDFHSNDPLFIYYFLRYTLRSIQSDKSAVPGVNRNDLHARNIIIPTEIQEQRLIASILSAYDDLIENNRRRMRLLEESARLLYREWFVNLRFPGHERCKIVDGVPEGWEKKTAFDLMDIGSGGTPKTTNSNYWDGDIPFFTPKDAGENFYVNSTAKYLTELGLKNCNSQLFCEDTIFITARGTVGKLALALRPMALNQSCYALWAHEPLTQFFLYCALLDSISEFKNRAVGAVFDAIIKDTFKSICLTIPNGNLIAMFTDHVNPIFLQLRNLLLQNKNLTAARDLLLPRLMSGEVRV